MKFSEKMCPMMMLGVTKYQGFTLSLEDTFFEKTTGKEGGGGVQIDPPPPAVLGLKVARSQVHATKPLKP